MNDKVAGLLSGQLANTMLGLVMIVFYAALMLWCDVSMTLVGVLAAFINLAVLRYFSRNDPI